MKKKALFLVASLAICGSMMLSSCKKSNADLINDYADVCKEMVEAIKDKDLGKMQKLAKEGEKIENELRERDLTPEEQKQVVELTAEIAKESMSGSGLDSLLDF